MQVREPAFAGSWYPNTAAGCRRLLDMVDRTDVQTYWQPLPAMSDAENVEDLTGLLSWVRNIHVFHWTAAADGSRERRPLAEGRSAWTAYLDALRATGNEHWLYLEFSEDDSPDNTVEDAAILRSLVERQ